MNGRMNGNTDGWTDRQADSLIDGGDVAPGVLPQHVSMARVNETVLQRLADVHT